MVGYRRRRRENAGSVGADQSYLENQMKKQRRKRKTPRAYTRTFESLSPLSHLIRGFRNQYLVLLIPHWEDGCVQFNKHIHTHTHTQVSLIPPWEDQCEWHRMTRMTGPDCAVMCNLINTHTHTHTQIYIYV